MNARYSKAISNDEILHTLSVFMFEAIHFIEKYKWRRLVLLEKVARYISGGKSV
jgi:hypothetical protein